MNHLIIVIIIGVIFASIILNWEKIKTLKEKKLFARNEEKPSKAHEDEHDDHDKPKAKSTVLSWIIVMICSAILAIILFIVVVVAVWGVGQITVIAHDVKKELAPTPPQIVSLYEYVEVNFSGEYGDIVYLPAGSMFAFLNATEPYCCMNADGHTECGEISQDVSTQMGENNANTQLRFKSSNGQNGSLKIRIRGK